MLSIQNPESMLFPKPEPTERPEPIERVLVQIPRFVSFGMSLEENVENYVTHYVRKNEPISQEAFKKLQPYTLPDLVYDILMATLSIKSCESSRNLRSQIGFPDHPRFLVRFHETYLGLKSLFELSNHNISNEDTELFFALKVAYRICQPLFDDKLEYLTSSGSELARQEDLIANEFCEMRAKLTSGHGRKEPVRFDAIQKAFYGRELCPIMLDELCDYFVDLPECPIKTRKYVSSCVSWFNKHAQGLDIGLQIVSDKVTRYYVRLST